MSDAGERLIEGAKEALEIARGNQPAARIHFHGHAYVPENRWQPIDSAPKDGTVFLSGDENGLMMPVALVSEPKAMRRVRRWLFWHTDELVKEAGIYVYGAIPARGGYNRLVLRSDWRPTHWMPLPSPPDPTP
jgi:hypothetical protein